MTAADTLRALAEAATPGPWRRLTIGTRSQAHAAAEAAMAVLATHVEDSPEIEFTDLSWIDTTPDEPHVALTGNGPKSVENAALIATLSPPVVLAIADLLDATEGHVPRALAPDLCRACGGLTLWPCPTAKARDAIEKLIGGEE